MPSMIIESKRWGTQEVLYDTKDATLLKGFRWYVAKFGRSKTLYAATHHQGKTLLMHRLIMNPKGDLTVDHLNGNGLDNRRKNLESVPLIENIQRTSKH